MAVTTVMASLNVGSVSVKLIDRKATPDASEQAPKPRRRGKVLGIAAAAILGFASIGAMAAPAQASTRLGGVQVAGACNNQWPGYWSVALVNNTVYGWRCQFNSSLGPVYYGVNLTQECVAEYGGGAFANFTDYNNPRSWSCYR